MGWPIGLKGDKLEPDAFLQFFNRRNLQFAFYVKSIPLGDSSAYDKNITTLNKYIKSIIYGEIEECKKQIANLENYKKNGWPISPQKDNLKDPFLSFFTRRDLIFVFYVPKSAGKLPLGDSSAYDKNINTLRGYIKELKATVWNLQALNL